MSRTLVLSEAEIRSSLAIRLREYLLAEISKRERECGSLFDATSPDRDSHLTWLCRGRIAELRSLLKVFEAGSEDPASFGDESP